MSTQGTTLDSLPPLETLNDSDLLYVVSNNKDYKLAALKLKQLVLANLPPSELPEGLVNEELLNTRLLDFYTKTQVDEAIATAVEAIVLPEGPDLSAYASKADLTAAIAAIVVPEALDLSNFATNAALDDAVAGATSQVLSSEAFTAVVTDLNDKDNQTAEALQTLSETVDLKLSKPAEAVRNAVLAFQDEQLVQLSAQLGRIFYVNRLTTNLNEDGSVFAPFKTIQAALNSVPASSTILVAPGAYSETITPPRVNILLQGSGCVGALQTEINGQVLITGATITRFRLKDMQVRNADVNTSPVKMDGGQLRHYFNNVVVELMQGSVVPAVHITGTPSNWVAFLNCDLGGDVLLDGTPAAGTAIYFNSGAHTSTHINIQAAYDVIVHDMVRLNGITHTAGNLSLTRVTGFGNKGLSSTADTGRLNVEFSSLRKKDGTFAPLVKSGQTAYSFDYFVYDETVELTGN